MSLPMQIDKKQQIKRTLPAELIFEIANFYSCIKTLQFLASNDANKTEKKRTIFDQILDEFRIVNYLVDMERFSNGANSMNRQKFRFIKDVVRSGSGWSNKCFFMALTNHLKGLKLWNKLRIINAKLNDYQKHSGQFLRYCSALEVPEISFLFVQYMFGQAREIAQGLDENDDLFPLYLGRLQLIINHMVQVFRIDANMQAKFQFAIKILAQKRISRGSIKHVRCKNIMHGEFDAIKLMIWLAEKGHLNLCFGTAMAALYPLSKRAPKQLPAAGVTFEEWFGQLFQNVSALCVSLNARFNNHQFWEGKDENRHQFISRVLWNIQDNAKQCAGNSKKMVKIYYIFASMLRHLYFAENLDYFCAFNRKVQYEFLKEKVQFYEYLQKIHVNTEQSLKMENIAQIFLNGKGLNFTNERYRTLACDYIIVFFYAFVRKCKIMNIRLENCPQLPTAN